MKEWRNVIKDPPPYPADGTVFEFKSSRDNEIRVFKVISYEDYGKFLLRIYFDKDITIDNLPYSHGQTIPLFSLSGNYLEKDMWRYLSSNEMMAYL